MYLPERLPHTIIGRKENERKKALLQLWERTANEYCWLGPIWFSAGVLLCFLYIYVFSIILFSSLGWGIKAGGGGGGGVGCYSWEGKRGERIFCYCPIRGWQYVYIYIVYMWWKYVGFLCDTTFYLYYGSTFSVSVLIIYIWFVFCFLSFFWFCLCHFLLFFLFFVVFFSYLSFWLLHGLLLLLSNEVTQLLFVLV